MYLLLNNNIKLPNLNESSIDINLVGSKAKRLSELILKGYNVPRGFILPSDIFDEMLKINSNYQGFNDYIVQPRYNTWKQISKTINNMIFPEDFTNFLRDNINDLKWPIVVRSSAIDEDGILTSKAGIYKSIINITNMNDLIIAIKQCWAASFSPLAKKFGGGDVCIPLVIQQMIKADYSGVAFSCNPNNKDSSVIMICGDKNAQNYIVSGELSGAIRVFKKDEFSVCKDYSKGDFPIDLAQDIARITSKIEKEMKMGYIDIEWAVKGGQVSILQVRPVTDCKIMYDYNIPKFADLDSEECLNIPLGNLYGLHERWFDKKHWFRTIAHSKGIRVINGGYLRYNPKTIDDNCLIRVGQFIKTPYVVIDFSPTKRTIKCKIENLIDILKLQIPDNSNMFTVRIRELPDFKISGFSTCLDNGNILIEMVPGAFSGIYKFGLVPSSYLLKQDGTLIKSNIRTYDSYCKIDPETLEFIKCSDNNILHLPESYLDSIVKMTNIMCKELIEPRLEWTIDEKEIFLYDLSNECKPLTVSAEKTNILSPGNFRGKIVLLEDVSHLIAVCGTHTISVVPEAEFYIAKKSREVLETINELSKNTEKPVVVAKQPLTELALIMDSVSSFIFKEGSILCHLGIILREAGIPAVFINDCFDKLTNNDEVIFTNDILRILHK